MEPNSCEIKFLVLLNTIFKFQTPLGDEHQSPWRFDPCQMDSIEASDEPMKILQGRVKILWVHGSNQPNFKLSITVVSKNEACRDKSKHSCLKFG